MEEGTQQNEQMKQFMKPPGLRQIRLFDPACQLIALGLDHARIKISDSDWQIMTNFAKVCVYYENQRCTSLCLKEEEVWQG